MHEVLVNRLGGQSLPRKSVVMLTGHPDMTTAVFRGRKTTIRHFKLRFQVLFNSISVISGLQEDGYSRPNEIEFRLRLERFLPLAGLEPGPLAQKASI